VPVDRLLVETDSPYLAPVPHRGKRNEPAYVKLVAEAVARVRDVGLEALEAETDAAFRELFLRVR
jgi:TatD DNase family protein